MKTVLFVVRDQKANNHTQPFSAPTRGIALRSWADQLNDPKHADTDQAKHPEDFSLWYVGDYDDNTAEITPARPEQMAIASDLKRS